jgi:16S rRNA (adenine1518-N6/adenine1519-N6)-dimethyltransferase
MVKKSLGQHFLFDPAILTRIAETLSAEPEETILEIGPGRGTLTAILAPRVHRLIVIEKDRDLIPDLRARFPRVEVVEGDALELDWHALAGQQRFSVIGNIPYNITSPLIDKALTPPRPRTIVFLVQKEVADRVAAPPGGAEYGALSVGVQAVSRVERLFRIPAGAFSPPPKVDSAVLRMTPLESPLVGDGDVSSFRRLVVGLFGFRRKQLIRGLRELTGQPAETVSSWLAQASIAAARRPQEISPPEFIALFSIMKAAGLRSSSA